MSARGLVPALAACLLLAAPDARGVGVYSDPNDPILHLDPLNLAESDVAELVPGLPWRDAGPDGELGTPDDTVDHSIVGDVDLVVRAGIQQIDGTIPAHASPSPRGVAEPFGEGVPVPLVVIPTDGAGPAAPHYFEGLPILVLAFADLDGDGFVGVTELDGDATDASIEAAELVPVGRRYVFGADGVAAGELAIEVGGPPGAEATVVLTAATYAGPLADPDAIKPDGPAVMTRLPFHPETDFDTIMRQGIFGPGPAGVEGAVGVSAKIALGPDPGDPDVGEGYTLRCDGSETSIDIARIASGATSRFGLVRVADPENYVALAGRPLRPWRNAAGSVRAVEVLNRLTLADDGPAGTETVYVVALDRLGNVTAPSEPTSVTLRSGGSVRIVSPDTDQDPFEETLVVADGVGVAVVLDDGGGVFDDADLDALIVEGGNALSRISVVLPDPDLNDSGFVTFSDALPIHLLLAAEMLRVYQETGTAPGYLSASIDMGNPAYVPRYDLDGDGRLTAADVFRVLEHLWERVPAA